jgi:adenylate cyclase
VVINDLNQNSVIATAKEPIGSERRVIGIAMDVTNEAKVEAVWKLRNLRSNLRLVSALTMLAFVVCHLTAHGFLLISFERAEAARNILMYPWRTSIGTTVLVTALIVHYLNALWSIYVRRYLRLARWEWWQLGLGLCIPVLLMLHVMSTRMAESMLGVHSYYSTILIIQWLMSPWLGVLQVAALLTVWIHACIGIHFWLRTKPWYPNWQAFFAGFGLLLPILALAGYVTAGNQVLREAKDPNYAKLSLEDSHLTGETRAQIGRIARIGWSIHVALVLLPFAGRGVRGWIYRRHRPPMLTHSGGRTIPILPGATVLETLRGNGIPHASVCGGRARCTTCRILVTQGLDRLPEPAGPEAKALARIGATPDMRLACQIRPTADINIVPLLAADANAVDGTVSGGLEGSERLITVVFVDLRGSTLMTEAKLPFDMLFILNQFFHEMNKALVATNGYYSQFTGDGLMALYGLNAKDPAIGAADALRGAREMLAHLDQLNHQLKGNLLRPLQIGIGVHFSEAIVGSMGPPRSQIITAIGDTVNTCARLESLTKEYDCPVIVSRQAAEMAGLDLTGRQLYQAPVKGRVETVEFYCLKSLADLRV